MEAGGSHASRPTHARDMQARACSVEGKGYLRREVGSVKEGSHEWGSRTFGVSAGKDNHAVLEESEVSQNFTGAGPCGE